MRQLLLELLVLSIAVSVQGQTVDMDIQPASASMSVGQTITLAVRVVAGANEVDQAEADLNFDPTVFQVVSITPRPAWLGGGSNTMDNTLGQANMAYATSAAFITGTSFVADVAFQAIGPSNGSDITFNVAFPRISAATRIGVPYTGIFTKATIEVLQGTATPTGTPGATGTPTPTATVVHVGTPPGQCVQPSATPIIAHRMSRLNVGRVPSAVPTQTATISPTLTVTRTPIATVTLTPTPFLQGPTQTPRPFRDMPMEF